VEATYPPLNQLKPVCDDLWIVDGPIIRYGLPWIKFAFPTRMTIIRMGGDLFVHSPTLLTRELRAELEEIGTPRWIIGPNRIHYWWIPDWRRAFPSADVYLAPGINAQAKSRIDFAHHHLDKDGGFPWDTRIRTLPVAGRYMTEVVFFDSVTRTLILTDLIENFEPGKLNSRFARWLTKAAGVQDPCGSTPRDMRLTYSANAELETAVRLMIGWGPDRIILAHGRWYEENGTEELRRAFGWLLGQQKGSHPSPNSQSATAQKGV
jgi:hypothetical protein